MSTTERTLETIFNEITTLRNEAKEMVNNEARHPVDNYTFTTTSGEPVTLAELFGTYDDLIVIHNMGRGCNYCTLWADGLTGFTKHLAERCAFVLASNDDWETARDFSQMRGWNYPVVSSRDTGFAQAMGFADGDDPWPGSSAFHKDADGSIRRTGKSWFGPGDEFCAIWPLMEMLEGGANGWEPK